MSRWTTAYQIVTAPWNFRSPNLEIAMSTYELHPTPSAGDAPPVPEKPFVPEVHVDTSALDPRADGSQDEVRYPFRPDWMKAADGPESGAASEEPADEPVAPPISKEDEEDAEYVEVEYELREFDITTELWREYEYGGQTYRIDEPLALFDHEACTTHRVLTADGVIHVVPVPGAHGCVLRRLNKDLSNPCEF